MLGHPVRRAPGLRLRLRGQQLDHPRRSPPHGRAPGPRTGRSSLGCRRRCRMAGPVYGQGNGLRGHAGGLAPHRLADRDRPGGERRDFRALRLRCRGRNADAIPQRQLRRRQPQRHPLLPAGQTRRARGLPAGDSRNRAHGLYGHLDRAGPVARGPQAGLGRRTRVRRGRGRLPDAARANRLDGHRVHGHHRGLWLFGPPPASR